MLYDILEHIKTQMKEDKAELKYLKKNEIAGSGMRSYYQGRYDAYYAIVDELKKEVKRLNLTI